MPSHDRASNRKKHLRYAASVMCSDLGNLETDFKTLEEAGCDELHFDIMDGRFVPNITLGPDFIRMAKGCCGLPCNAHLMIIEPERYIDRFINAGCDSLTIHVESTGHIHRAIDVIRELGVSPGIAINPATSLTKLEYLLDYVDRVLIMAVDPGYAGQKMIPGAFDRVGILADNIRYRELRTKIEVDGNIDVVNAANLANKGAGILVLGTSSIFTGGDLKKAFAEFKDSVARERRNL